MYGRFSFFPEQASRHAAQVDLLYFALVAVTVFFTVGVVAAALYFIVKYRRRPGNEMSIATPESLWLEVTWTVIPLIIAMGLFVAGTKLFINVYAGPPDNAMEIFATGKRWMWKFQQPDGRREINTLHVPTGRAVKMTMISEDVIHNFFVPAFRVQQDVLPFRYSTTWFEPIKPGTYHLFCNQYCGTDHSSMVGTVIVMEPADYQAWLASPVIEGGPPRDPTVPNTAGSALVVGGSDADKGKAVLDAQGCRVCHKTTDGLTCPKLEGIWGKSEALEGGKSVTVNEDYVRESILVPTAKIVKGYMPLMPSFQGRISEEEIKYIIAYLKSTAGEKK